MIDIRFARFLESNWVRRDTKNGTIRVEPDAILIGMAAGCSGSRLNRNQHEKGIR
jgi:hypothetical protein